MSYKTTTPPSEEPVTLAQAKLQCRADGTSEDTLLTGLITAARQLAEHRTNRLLITQTVQWVLPHFCGCDIAFPVAPVQSITSITYLDTNGTEQTLPTSVYALDATGTGKHYLRLKNGQSWPSTFDKFDAVKITFVAGYGAAAAVPQAVKQWVLMAIDTMYQNRGLNGEAQAYELPGNFCQGLLDTVKIWGL